MSRTVLAIDVGSTKICAVIAQIENDNSMNIDESISITIKKLKDGEFQNQLKQAVGCLNIDS